MTPHLQSSLVPKFVHFTHSAAIAIGTSDQGSVYIVPYPTPSCFPPLIPICLLTMLTFIQTGPGLALVQFWIRGTSWQVFVCLFVFNREKKNNTSSGKQREVTHTEEAYVQTIPRQKKFYFLELHVTALKICLRMLERIILSSSPYHPHFHFCFLNGNPKMESVWQGRNMFCPCLFLFMISLDFWNPFSMFVGN